MARICRRSRIGDGARHNERELACRTRPVGNSAKAALRGGRSAPFDEPGAPLREVGGRLDGKRRRDGPARRADATWTAVPNRDDKPLRHRADRTDSLPTPAIELVADLDWPPCVPMTMQPTWSAT